MWVPLLARHARRGALAPTAALLLVLAAPVASFGQTDWLKRGQDLLKQVPTDATSASAGSLSQGEIASGLKEALTVGTGRVVSQLSAPGGFDADPAVHIPLPAGLGQVQSALDTVGMSSLLDDLELRLNRAAEQATPQAKALFLESIQEMSVDDARGILGGPDDAATRYFQGKMSPRLSAAMEPIVETSLADVGAVQAYDRAMAQYDDIPFAPDASADLTAYVVEKGMDGIFLYLAQEEAAIRTDPAARSTELLKTVFGQ